MVQLNRALDINFETIPVDESWNFGIENELKIHRIHSYPAKFPSFITTKAIEYAKNCGIRPSLIADIFCGCGTVAFEANRQGISFWGCDINPIATMIAKVKSKGTYQVNRLHKYYSQISQTMNTIDISLLLYENANPRIQYWFHREQFNSLLKIQDAIYKITPPNSDYRLFFECAFSNILKPCSRWLNKSIKPQIDPHKKNVCPIKKFEQQYYQMIKCLDDYQIKNKTNSMIVTSNFLELQDPPLVDMIITSPPYVTSYEYADLHQLSTLWLNYVEDYKELRKGTIGSLFHDFPIDKNMDNLSCTGVEIVSKLTKIDPKKARSVAKYFYDIEHAAVNSYKMLSENGLILLVIGNTEYKGILIDNAKHLCESLFKSGFSKIYATKRKISNKILPVYRDKIGKFTSQKSGRRVYAEEFIIIAHK